MKLHKPFFAGLTGAALLVGIVGTPLAQPLLPLAQPTVFAQEEAQTTADRFVYTVTDGAACITQYTGKASDVAIPAALDGCPVTEIAARAFADCDFLESVTFPETLTAIGEEAFSGCSALTEAKIPDGVTTIPDGVFRHCTRLQSVTIPDSVTRVDSNAFWNTAVYNRSQTPLVLADGWVIGYIGEGATALVLPDSIRGLGENAFLECEALTALTIPDGVTDIPMGLCSGCRNLASVTLPDGVKCIDSNAFWNCEALTAIRLPDTLTTIGGHAFFACTALKEIAFPTGVTEIGAEAFSLCNALTEVTIPASIGDLGENAFGECDALEEIHVASENKVYTDRDGVLFLKDCSRLLQYPIGSKRESYTLPAGVTDLSERAFNGCTFLKKIVLPDGMTAIANSAFEGCASLTEIVLPDSLKVIGENAFAQCVSLTGMVVPDGVVCINDCAFSYCTALAKVELPDSVEILENNPFFNCMALTEITIPGGVAKVEGVCYYCFALKTVVIPGTVTHIADSAFGQCPALTDIYYAGTEAQWEKIQDGIWDDSTTVTIHFNATGPELLIPGDLNGDGNITPADTVLLQDWLLAKPGATVPDLQAADCNRDGRLDAFDLSRLKQTLLQAAPPASKLPLIAASDDEVSAADRAALLETLVSQYPDTDFSDFTFRYEPTHPLSAKADSAFFSILYKGIRVYGSGALNDDDCIYAAIAPDEKGRRQMLFHFGLAPDEYAAIDTGASGLPMEQIRAAYPDLNEPERILYLSDSHGFTAVLAYRFADTAQSREYIVDAGTGRVLGQNALGTT